MNATDELRRLLDERGVEWNNVFASAPRNDFTTFEPELGTTVNVWQGGSLLGIEVETSYSFTPEQVVEATLGSDLEAENEKLRELVLDYEELTAKLCDSRECDGCPFDDTEQIVCEHMRLQTCLSELGMED